MKYRIVRKEEVINSQLGTYYYVDKCIIDWGWISWWKTVTNCFYESDQKIIFFTREEAEEYINDQRKFKVIKKQETRTVLEEYEV